MNGFIPLPRSPRESPNLCTMGHRRHLPSRPLVSHDAPSIRDLVLLIIASKDKLFFILHKVGTSCWEWRLVRVALKDSLSLYRACLQDGRCLVRFYIGHPDNVHFNAINQQFLLKYCNCNALMFGTMDAHLITPLDSSENQALCNHLVPVCTWINLTHGNAFIYGPFDCATVWNCKTRDRIDQQAWDALALRHSMFQNWLPWFDLPTYFIHVDHGVHTVFCNLITVDKSFTLIDSQFWLWLLPQTKGLMPSPFFIYSHLGITGGLVCPFSNPFLDCCLMHRGLLLLTWFCWCPHLTWQMA